jgi:hypothetical protein
MQTTNVVKYALGAVAVVAAVLVVRSWAGQRDAEWQERVERVQATAEAALAFGDSLRVEAAELGVVADSLKIEADRRDTVIVTKIKELPVIVTKIKELPAPPVDCEPFTLPRDSVIVLQEERYDAISEAFDRERQAAALLRQAEARARTAADSLSSVLDDRPRPLSPLIPKVGLGATAGICTTGQPCVAVGLTLSWEVRLF